MLPFWTYGKIMFPITRTLLTLFDQKRLLERLWQKSYASSDQYLRQLGHLEINFNQNSFTGNFSSNLLEIGEAKTAKVKIDY